MKQRTTALLIVMFAALVTGMHFDMKRTLDSDFIDEISSNITRNVSWTGKTAPDFELTLTDDTVFRLSDHIGKKVVIINFFATWCGPCKSEMPELVSYHKSLEGRDVVMLGIDADEKPQAVQGFIKEFEVDYPVGIDDEMSDVGEKYGVRGYPTTVVIGVDGRIQLYEVGPIMNADVALGGITDSQLALLEGGGGISFEDYTGDLRKEDFSEVTDGYDPDIDDDEHELTGRAREISLNSYCLCGCDHLLAECGCKTADDMAEWLAEADMEGKTDEEIIKEMNARFCEEK